MGTIRTINFKDSEADLQTLGAVCRELEAKGLTPSEAAASVLAQMASEAQRNGMDNKEVMDALFTVISGQNQPAQHPNVAAVRRGAITEMQAEEIKAQVKFLQNTLLYWDMILCSQIQQLAYRTINSLKEQGLYRHEFKKYANALNDEARRLQIRIKDNDKALVLKWCRRIDGRRVYTHEFFEDGASIVSKFSLAYAEKFHLMWEAVRLDCRTIAGYLSEKYDPIVAGLLELEALTHTGVDLFDTCVRRMKNLVAGHGKASITKSSHHESMRNAVYNLLRKFGKASQEVPEEHSKYAREHLAAMQTAMVQESAEDLFQDQFDALSNEFIHYMMAWMRIDLEYGKPKLGAIRLVYERLGTRHRAEKFFKQLREIPIPEEDADVWDVADELIKHVPEYKELNRFKTLCMKGERHIPDESQAKQEARILRQQARKNKGILPNEMIAVMAMHYKTKKALVEHLGTLGFELKPTLDKVKKMKASELKQIA